MLDTTIVGIAGDESPQRKIPCGGEAADTNGNADRRIAIKVAHGGNQVERLDSWRSFPIRWKLRPKLRPYLAARAEPFARAKW